MPTTLLELLEAIAGGKRQFEAESDGKEHMMIIAAVDKLVVIAEHKGYIGQARRMLSHSRAHYNWAKIVFVSGITPEGREYLGRVRILAPSSQA